MYVTRQLKYVGSSSSQGSLSIHTHSAPKSPFQKPRAVPSTCECAVLTSGSRGNVNVSNILETTETNFFFPQVWASKRSPSSIYVYSVPKREQTLKRAGMGFIFMMYTLPPLLLDLINNTLCSIHPRGKGEPTFLSFREKYHLSPPIFAPKPLFALVVTPWHLNVILTHLHT